MTIFNTKNINIYKNTFLVIASFVCVFLFSPVNTQASIDCVDMSTQSISGMLTSPFGGLNTGLTNSSKECVLASIKSSLKEEVLTKISSSTIDWINSGFDGRPVYMTDPYQVFNSVKEQVVEDVIYNNKNLDSLHPDFELPMKFALNQYFFDKEEGDLGFKPKSTEVFDKDKPFSWSNFAETTKPDNRFSSVYNNLVTDINDTITTRKDVLQKELDMGGGYFSIRSCEDGWEYDGSPESARHCRIVTPGATISEHVGKVMGSNFDRALLANEVDGLMGTFVNNVMDRGGNGNGLASFSDPDYSFMQSSDKAFAAERERLLQQYNDYAYDVGVKTLQSMQISLNNAKTIMQNDLTCWQNKQIQKTAGSTFYRDASVNDVDMQYEFLSDTTIANNIQYILDSNQISSVDTKINTLNKEIVSLMSQKQSINSIRQSIADATDYGSLYNVIKYTATTGVDFNTLGNSVQSIKVGYTDILDGTVTTYKDYQPIRTGGINTSYQYCKDFTIIQQPSGAKVIKNSIEEVASLINSRKAVFMDAYNFQDDLKTIKNIDIPEMNFNDPVDSTLKYNNLISASYLSKVGPEVITNWKDFFIKESLVKFSSKNTYLAHLIKTEHLGFSDYNINSYPVSKKVTYNQPIYGELVDKMVGNGQYCTKDGWNRYKVYIPPFAEKIALLFRPEKNILHRVHLTFNSSEINHNNVKALSYDDIPQDENHYGLADLFQNQKTVLLNIKYQGLMLDDKGAGVSVAGLVVRKDKIEKYIGANGGWLYIDIAQDNEAAGKVSYSTSNKVKILYYTGVDRLSSVYKNWVTNADLRLQEVAGVEVFEKNCQ